MSDKSRHLARIAGAPISWGVSEVPDWGHQLPSARVLEDLRSLGLRATEFGPTGFLPEDPHKRGAYLSRNGLRGIGGFLPVVLHDAVHDPMPEVKSFLDGCQASGAEVLVLAASTGTDGYDTRPVLDEGQWTTLYANLDRISSRTADVDVVTVLHPHIGTVIENADELQRVLDNTDVLLCMDTGHLCAAGADPVVITVDNPDRVGHVHLKDVDAELAKQVQTGALPFSEAVAAGLFRPLGTGSVDVRALVNALEAVDYQGWYVLEQDLKLAEPPAGVGPVADVRTSLEFLLGVLGGSA